MTVELKSHDLENGPSFTSCVLSPATPAGRAIFIAPFLSAQDRGEGESFVQTSFLKSQSEAQRQAGNRKEIDRLQLNPSAGLEKYRARKNGLQNIFKKDPSRAKQQS